MNLETLKRRIAFILALTIPFTATGCGRNNSNKNSANSMFLEERVTPEELTAFLTNIAEITPIYNLEDIYLSEEEIDAVIEASENIQECDNTSLDSNEIYNSIIANSIDENDQIMITDELSDREREEADHFIKDCIKQAVENMVQRNKISLEDACVMKGLRIIIGKTNSNSCIEYFGGSKALIIDYQNFKKFYAKYQNEAYREYYIKEGMIRYFELGLNYCRLQTCDCRLEKGESMNSIGDISNALDCLMGSAFYSDDNSYMSTENERFFDNLNPNLNHSSSLLLLLATFKENRNIEDLYQIVFDSNLQELFAYFGLTTKEEIEEFYKIARTIEVLTNDDYENEYNESESSNGCSFRDHVGYGYKVDIFKSSISDLMRAIASDKDINSKEAMFLYKFVKSIVINNANIGKTEDQYDPRYVNGIIGVENTFFEFLCKFYGLTMEEADELYEDYYSHYGLESELELSTINFKKLVRKFPLLKFIDQNYQLYYSFMDNFDEQTRK